MPGLNHECWSKYATEVTLRYLAVNTRTPRVKATSSRSVGEQHIVSH